MCISTIGGGIQASASLQCGLGVSGQQSTDFMAEFRRHHDCDQGADGSCGQQNDQLQDIGQSLVQVGQELVQEGQRLIQQGDFQQGMRLVREGARLEQQGARLETQGGEGTDPYNPMGPWNPMGGQDPFNLMNGQFGSPFPTGMNGTSSDVGSSSGLNANAQPLSSGAQVQAKQIYQYLMSKYGFTPAQAAGILGNMQVESSLNTGATNSVEGAIGLAQWEGGRRTALEQYAASQGKPVTDWKVQVDFMMQELRGSESGAYSALKSATTPGQAAAVFDQDYERSAGTSRAQRIADANSIAAQLA